MTGTDGKLTYRQAELRKIAGYTLSHLERNKSVRIHDLQYYVTGSVPRTANQVFTKGYAKSLHKTVGEVITMLERRGHVVRKNNIISPTDAGLKSLKAWRAVEHFRFNQCAYHNAMIEIMEWCGEEGSYGYTKEMIDTSISMFKHEQRHLLEHALEILVRAKIIEINDEYYRTNKWIESEVYKYMMPVGTFDVHVAVRDDYSRK